MDSGKGQDLKAARAGLVPGSVTSKQGFRQTRRLPPILFCSSAKPREDGREEPAGAIVTASVSQAFSPLPFVPPQPGEIFLL